MPAAPLSPTTGNWVPSGNDLPRLQGQLRFALNNLSQAQATIQQLANVMSQMVAGGSSYTCIETYFGIPTGLGQTLSNVVGSANTDLQGGNIQALIQQFG